MFRLFGFCRTSCMMMHMYTGYITSQSCLVLDISLWLQGTQLYLGKRKKYSLHSKRAKKRTHTHKEHITRSDREREKIQMKWKKIGIMIHLSVLQIKPSMRKKIMRINAMTNTHTHANISINVCGLLDYRV